MPEEDRVGKTSHAEVKGEFVGILVPPDGMSEAGKMEYPVMEPDEGDPGYGAG